MTANALDITLGVGGRLTLTVGTAILAWLAKKLSG